MEARAAAEAEWAELVARVAVERAEEATVEAREAVAEEEARRVAVAAAESLVAGQVESEAAAAKEVGGWVHPARAVAAAARLHAP